MHENIAYVYTHNFAKCCFSKGMHMQADAAMHIINFTMLEQVM